MAVDFVPVFEPYKHTGKFRFWCQKVLPTVYDDSLSYYELLCKVVNYLNDVIENLDKVEDNLELLRTSFSQLQDWTITQIDAMKGDIETFKSYVNETLSTMREDIAAFKQDVTSDIADFKTDVNATLATFETRFTELSNSLDTKFTTLRNSINQQFSTLETNLERTIDTKIETAIDAMAEQLVPIAEEAAQDAVDTLVQQFNARVTALETEYATLTQGVQTLTNKTNMLNVTKTNLLRNSQFGAMPSRVNLTAMMNGGGLTEPLGWKTGVFVIDNQTKLSPNAERKGGYSTYGICGATYFQINNVNRMVHPNKFLLISDPVISSNYTSGPPSYPNTVIFKGTIKLFLSSKEVIEFTLNGVNDIYTTTVSHLGIRVYLTPWWAIYPAGGGDSSLRLVVEFYNGDSQLTATVYLYSITLYQVNSINDEVLSDDISTNCFTEYNYNLYDKQNARVIVGNLRINKLTEPGEYYLQMYINDNTIIDGYYQGGFNNYIESHTSGIDKHIITVTKEYLKDRLIFKQRLYYYYNSSDLKCLVIERIGNYGIWSGGDNQSITDDATITWYSWNMVSNPEYPAIGSTTAKYVLQTSSNGYSWVEAPEGGSSNLPDAPTSSGTYSLKAVYQSDPAWEETNGIEVKASSPKTSGGQFANGGYIPVFMSSGKLHTWEAISHYAALVPLIADGETGIAYEGYFDADDTTYKMRPKIWSGSYKEKTYQFNAGGLTGARYSVNIVIKSNEYPVQIEGFVTGSLPVSGATAIPLTNNGVLDVTFRKGQLSAESTYVHIECVWKSDSIPSGEYNIIGAFKCVHT